MSKPNQYGRIYNFSKTHKELQEDALSQGIYRAAPHVVKVSTLTSSLTFRPLFTLLFSLHSRLLYLFFAHHQLRRHLLNQINRLLGHLRAI